MKYNACLFFSAVLLFTGCTPAQTPSKTMKQEDKEIQLLQSKGPWYFQYKYAVTDGNTNFYLFGYNWFPYLPVKQEESSSGLYSGGKEMRVKDKIIMNEYCLLVEATVRLSRSFY